MSASHDGGVARHFSLVTGWAASYPETTGYIVPTVLEHAARTGDASLRERGRRMLDWLVSIQLEEGGFQGGTIGATPVVPVTFNTGQILLGLAAGVRQLGEAYRPAMRAAADWLVATQDPDGCWRRHPTPFAARGEKAYETHVAWGLLEAARLDPDRRYAEAALRQVRWALTHQAANGWFACCCLDDPSQPLTHTIGYVLRGLVEAWRFSGDRAMLAAARRTADGVLGALRGDGYLPGRLDDEWRGTVRWVCLTGAVQIAHCWLQLFEDTGDARYLDAARAANAWVRSTIRVDGREDTRGGVKGSFPIWGTYGQYEYLNWAAKFLIDANTLEAAVIARGT
jgi:rhamnogalacturonyl hydrolase YesR